MSNSSNRRSALLALLLPLFGCGQSGTTTLISLTADDKVDKYDLYIRDEASRLIILHTGWTDATLGATRDISAEPLRLGLSFDKMGMMDGKSYALVLIGVAGDTEGDKPAVGAKQFFWAKVIVHRRNAPI